MEKKLIPNSANIDLMGCEDENTIRMQSTILEDDKCINQIDQIIVIIQNTNTAQLSQIECVDKVTLVDRIKSTFQHIGHRMQTVRGLKTKKAYALSKLEEKGSDAMTKDQFLMNHLKTFLYLCSNTISDATVNLNNLIICEVIAELNGAGRHFVKNKKASLQSQQNYVELMKPEDVARSINVERSAIPTQYLKQRSPEWFEERKKFKVTGSTAFTAIGLDTLKEQKLFFDKTLSGLDISKTDAQISAMDYGTQNEANAVATLVTKIMPVLYPKLTFFEEGAYKVSDESQDKPYLIVSPDGSLRDMSENKTALEKSAKVGIEIKCPTDNIPFKSPVLYSPPRRYVPQCLLEQSVLGCDEQLLISWSPETTTVLKIPYVASFVDNLLSEVKTLYYTNVPHRPTKSSDKRKGLLQQIDECIQSCEFLGEFPSVTCLEENNTDIENLPGEPYCMGRRTSTNSINLPTDTVCKTLLKSKSVLESMKQIYHKKASEVVLFSLSDTDRTWQKEIGHGMPVGYFTKGYSLTSECMRNIQSKMLNTCSESGIHIPCVTFDGQWYKLKDENAEGRPLTLFQAQRQHWNEICKLSKDQIVNALCATHMEIVTESIHAHGIIPKTTIFAASGDMKLDFPRGKLKQSTKVTQTKDLPENCDEDNDNLCNLDNEGTKEDHMNSSLSTADADNVGGITVAKNTQTFTYTLTDNDRTCIRTMLMNSNRKKNRFTHETLEHVDKLFESADAMGKLTDPELKNIIDYINIQVKGKGKELSSKGRKGNKINEICKILGIQSLSIDSIRIVKRKVKSSKALKDLAKASIKMFSKNVLDAIYASYKWPHAKQMWLAEVPLGDSITVQDTGYSFTPLYSPETVMNNGKEMLQVKCLNGHHIRTNIRAKLCKDGTENLRKQAWLDVAKTKKTKLSLAMIEVNKDGKILDQQSDRYVRTMFCEDVEKELHCLGYEAESEFTKLFRQWHEAEDLPGILAVERCRRALALREWLLKGVNVEDFPPPGMYIKGFPKVTFEGLVCSIEAHIYMYGLCLNGTYNWRSMSTLVAENLFGEVSEMESHNNGVPSGDSFRRNLAVMAGLNAVRLKPDRYL